VPVRMRRTMDPFATVEPGPGFERIFRFYTSGLMRDARSLTALRSARGRGNTRSEEAIVVEVLNYARAASDGTRMKSMTQLVSHVTPPSWENACSQWGESVRVCDQMKLTRVGLPSNESSE
jgi:hypothetical protein